MARVLRKTEKFSCNLVGNDKLLNVFEKWIIESESLFKKVILEITQRKDWKRETVMAKRPSRKLLK